MEIVTAVGIELMREAIPVFYRQVKLMIYPDMESQALLKDITVLDQVTKHLENTDAKDELPDGLEIMVYDIRVASNLILSHRNLSPRQKLRRSNRKKLVEAHKKLNDHLDNLAAFFASSDNDYEFDIEAAKADVAKRLDKEYQKKLKASIDELVASIDKATQEGKSAEALRHFYELSNVLGQESAALKHLRGKVAEFVRAKDSKDNRIQKWETGIQTLGPLGVEKVLLQADDVRIFKDEQGRDFLEVEKETENLLRLCTITEVPGHPIAELSAFEKVTVDDATRKALLIPSRARKFAFVYPVKEFVGAPLDLVGASSNVELLLIHGGYIYIDHDGEFVQANCFASDKNENPFICFTGPFPLGSAAVQTLESKGEFRPVTAKVLLDQGATKFCWIKPGQKLGLRSSTEKLWQHGAFAYQYDNGTTSNFFPVASIADVLGITNEAYEAGHAASFLDFGGSDESTLLALTDEPTSSGGGGCCIIC
mmetsp:Transcript_6603/g.12193  ORF Transcript_6603/g.12193 Transcript_6603/m.12193 type:complete len:482 (+) Transcript_6603:144-1589(+)